MAQAAHGELADVVRIAGDPDAPVEDLGRAVDAPDIGQAHLLPVALRDGGDRIEQRSGAPAQGQEVDASLVDPPKVGMRRQPGIEHQFPGRPAIAFLPEPNEPEDFVILILLADPGVGVDEQAGVGVAGKEGEDSLLPAAPLGDVVPLDGRLRVLPVPGYGVEVEVEGAVPAEVRLQAVQSPVPAVHEAGAQLRVDAPGILGQARPLGHGVQPGEQGHAGIEDVGHDVRRPAHPPELQRQQGPEGMAGGDHAAARHAAVGGDPVEVEPDKVGDEQEQPAEAGAQAPRRKVERPGVGDRGGDGPKSCFALAGRAARQLADAVAAERALHGRGSGRHPLLCELPADLADREAGGPAELEDAPVPPQPEGLVGVRLRTRPALGEKGGQVGVPAQLRAQVAEGSEAVSEAPRRLPGLDAVEEVGPERLVLEVGPGLRLAEEFGQVGHGNACSLDAIATILHHGRRRKQELRGTAPSAPGSGPGCKKVRPGAASEGGRRSRKPRRSGCRCRADARHGSVTIGAKNLKCDDSIRRRQDRHPVGSGRRARQTPPAERCRNNPAICGRRRIHVNCGRWESRLGCGRGRAASALQAHASRNLPPCPHRSDAALAGVGERKNPVLNRILRWGRAEALPVRTATSTATDPARNRAPAAAPLPAGSRRPAPAAA